MAHCLKMKEINQKMVVMVSAKRVDKWLNTLFPKIFFARQALEKSSCRAFEACGQLDGPLSGPDLSTTCPGFIH
jgi:hypothetical protein